MPGGGWWEARAAACRNLPGSHALLLGFPAAAAAAARAPNVLNSTVRARVQALARVERSSSGMQRSVYQVGVSVYDY